MKRAGAWRSIAACEPGLPRVPAYGKCSCVSLRRVVGAELPENWLVGGVKGYGLPRVGVWLCWSFTFGVLIVACLGQAQICVAGGDVGEVNKHE